MYSKLKKRKERNKEQGRTGGGAKSVIARWLKRKIKEIKNEEKTQKETTRREGKKIKLKVGGMYKKSDGSEDEKGSRKEIMEEKGKKKWRK